MKAAIVLAVVCVAAASANVYDVMDTMRMTNMPYMYGMGRYNTMVRPDVMYGTDRDTMYMYLAKKLDMDVMRMMMTRFMGMGMHMLPMDIDMMRVMMAKRMGMDMNVMDVDTMKIMMVKHMMDMEVMRVMLARHTGIDMNIMDINMMKMILGKYMHMGIHMMDEIEMMKMAMAKYMMHMDTMRMMGMHKGMTMMDTGMMRMGYPYMNMFMRYPMMYNNMYTMY